MSQRTTIAQLQEAILSANVGPNDFVSVRNRIGDVFTDLDLKRIDNGLSILADDEGLQVKISELEDLVDKLEDMTRAAVESLKELEEYTEEKIKTGMLNTTGEEVLDRIAEIRKGLEK